MMVAIYNMKYTQTNFVFTQSLSVAKSILVAKAFCMKQIAILYIKNQSQSLQKRFAKSKGGTGTIPTKKKI